VHINMRRFVFLLFAIAGLGVLAPLGRGQSTGNYNLLAFTGENLALEFIYGGPQTMFSHLHRPGFSGTDAGGAPKQ
jgi:hypothetical protein